MSCLKLSSVLVGVLLLAPKLAEAQQPPPPYAPLPAPPPAAYPPPAPYPNVAPYPQAPWAGAPQPYPQPYPYAAPAPYAQPSAPREWNGGAAKKRVSTGAMAGGIVLLSLGVVLAGTGGSLYFSESSQSCTTNGQGFDCTTPGRSLYLGLFVTGVVAVVAGIPLIAYGARYETPDEASARRDPRRLLGAPSANGWAWSF